MAAAAAANLDWPKLLFIVQSNGQFQINVIAKLPAVRFFSLMQNNGYLVNWHASRCFCFIKKTNIKCGLEKENDPHMTFITTRLLI